MPKIESTRQKLLEAGGALFAEHGVEGASVRAIARKAGANLAAVNYHFGSKENLYREALLHVGRLDKEALHMSAFLERARAVKQKQEFADLLADMVWVRCAVYMGPGRDHWHTQLFLRSFLRPGEELPRVVEELLRPDLETLVEILRLARPNLGYEEARRFGFSVLAEISFYCFARHPILIDLGSADFGGEFVLDTARHVTHLLCAGLGLPQPDEQVFKARARLKE